MREQQKYVLLAGATVSVVALLGLIWYLRKRSQEEEEDENEELEFADLSATTMATTSQYTVEVVVPRYAVGVVIGKGGQTIRQLMKDTGVRLEFNKRKEEEQEEDKDENRILLLKGERERVLSAEIKVKQFIADIPPVISIEFFVPQEVCGRIIGKGGKTIRDICQTSNAKVEVDRSTAVDAKERKVTITGTKQHVDYAEGMVNEILETHKVWKTRQDQGKGKAKTNQLKDEEKTPLIAPVMSEFPVVSIPTHGDYFQVFVSAFEQPDHLWVQPINADSTQLDSMGAAMTAHFNATEGGEMETGRKGDLCCAPFSLDKDWYRACITNLDKEGNAELYYIDYGDTGTMPIAKLKAIRPEFLQLPAQAVECNLSDIMPNGDQWTPESIAEFEKLTYCAQWVPLMARVLGYKETGEKRIPSVQLVDTSDGKNLDIAKEMARLGHAMLQDVAVKPTDVVQEESVMKEERLVTAHFDPSSKEPNLPAKGTQSSAVEKSAQEGLKEVKEFQIYPTMVDDINTAVSTVGPELSKFAEYPIGSDVEYDLESELSASHGDLSPDPEWHDTQEHVFPDASPNINVCSMKPCTSERMSTEPSICSDEQLESLVQSNTRFLAATDKTDVPLMNNVDSVTGHLPEEKIAGNVVQDIKCRNESQESACANVYDRDSFVKRPTKGTDSPLLDKAVVGKDVEKPKELLGQVEVRLGAVSGSQMEHASITGSSQPKEQLASNLVGNGVKDMPFDCRTGVSTFDVHEDDVAADVALVEMEAQTEERPNTAAAIDEEAMNPCSSFSVDSAAPNQSSCYEEPEGGQSSSVQSTRNTNLDKPLLLDSTPLPDFPPKPLLSELTTGESVDSLDSEDRFPVEPPSPPAESESLDTSVGYISNEGLLDEHDSEDEWCEEVAQAFESGSFLRDRGHTSQEGIEDYSGEALHGLNDNTSVRSTGIHASLSYDADEKQSVSGLSNEAPVHIVDPDNSTDFLDGPREERGSSSVSETSDSIDPFLTSMELARQNLLHLSTDEGTYEDDDDDETDSFISARSYLTPTTSLDTDTDSMSFYSARGDAATPTNDTLLHSSSSEPDEYDIISTPIASDNEADKTVTLEGVATPQNLFAPLKRDLSHSAPQLKEPPLSPIHKSSLLSTSLSPTASSKFVIEVVDEESASPIKRKSKSAERLIGQETSV